MRCESHGIEPEDADRSCGFLSETEREYLLGEWDPNDDGGGFSEGQEKRKRGDVKTRARHAMADLTLLQRYGDSDLKDEIIKRNTDPPIFDEESLEYMKEGMLALASDAAVDESFSEFVQLAMENEEASKNVLKVFEAHSKGPDQFRKTVLELMDQQ